MVNSLYNYDEENVLADHVLFSLCISTSGIFCNDIYRRATYVVPSMIPTAVVLQLQSTKLLDKAPKQRAMLVFQASQGPFVHMRRGVPTNSSQTLCFFES